MKPDIYNEPMPKAYLFGTPVLCVYWPIPREDVPQGWYCYGLQGTTESRPEHYRLVDQVSKNRIISVLSYLPLKNENAKSRLVKNSFQRTDTSFTLSKFCLEEKIICPEIPLWHLLRPASLKEAGLFYTQTHEIDEARGAIGHPRSLEDYCGSDIRKHDLKSKEPNCEVNRLLLISSNPCNLAQKGHCEL